MQIFQLEEDYTNEILTEILYRSAKQEVLNGRYICDIDLSIKLAALQMAVDLEPNEELDILDISRFVTFSSITISRFQGNIILWNSKYIVVPDSD